MANDRYSSPENFVVLSGLSINTIRRRLAKGQLPAHQSGGPGTAWKIDYAAYQAQFAIGNGQAVAKGTASASDQTSHSDHGTAEMSVHLEAAVTRSTRSRWRRRLPQT